MGRIMIKIILMMDCFDGLVDATASAEHEVPGSIPRSGEVTLDFSVRKIPLVACETVVGNLGRTSAYQKDVPIGM